MIKSTIPPAGDHFSAPTQSVKGFITPYGVVPKSNPYTTAAERGHINVQLHHTLPFSLKVGK